MMHRITGLLKSMAASVRAKQGTPTQLNGSFNPARNSREAVIWAYRLFLDRDPENPQIIVDKLNAWATIPELRLEFMTSAEFRLKNPGLGYTPISNVVIKEIDKHLRLFVDLADQTIGFRIAQGLYEPDEVRFIRKMVKSGNTVIDLGANIGYMTMVMADLVGPTGHVYAFEPMDQQAELLNRSIAENNFERRVTLEQAAVSDSEGSTKLLTFPSSLNSGGSYLLPGREAVPPGHILQAARQICLDRYPLRRPVEFMKIDIEGAELLALRGAQQLLQEDHPIILTELHPIQLKKVSDCTVEELNAFREGCGYTGYVLEGDKMKKTMAGDRSSGIRTGVFLPN